MIQVQKNESFEDIHGFQEDAAKKFVKSLDAINKSLAVFSWNNLAPKVSV